MNICRTCGYAIMPPDAPMGIIGQFCMHGGAHPVYTPPPLTEDDIRRIVRDELDRAKEV